MSKSDFSDKVPKDSKVFKLIVLSAISESGGVLLLYKTLTASSVSNNLFLTSSFLFEGNKFKHIFFPIYVVAKVDNVSKILKYSNLFK